MSHKNAEKLILLILDGWGYREDPKDNAISACNPENYNKLLMNNPSTFLNAGGEDVGLPDGQMGNSEVGHMNIGAGRVVYQDLLRITKSFESGEASSIPTFKNFIKNVKNKSGRVHLIGLISDGGVHSHIDHFKSALQALKKDGITEVYIHAFTDGRDTPPRSGIDYLTDLDEWTKENGIGKISDICGRFYAMDRDKRWERVEKAYNLLFKRDGESFSEVRKAFENSYAKDITDEFISPVVIDGIDGTIKDGDGVFFMNFRADRVRELLTAMYTKDFEGFKRDKKPDIEILTITQYDEKIPVPVMFEKHTLANIFGSVISNAGLKQLRIAETEKYAHVTYFFNGGEETPFPGEERIMIPSARDVPTYDLKPEMSVREVEQKFQERFEKGDINVVVMNFANPDMVGHTGVFEAAVKACKAVDEMLGKVVAVADRAGAALLVTADHGNAELMWDYEHNQPHTSHTTNPVRLIIHNFDCKINTKTGKLADIAPTMLKILGIDIPKEMTGNCLID